MKIWQFFWFGLIWIPLVLSFSVKVYFKEYSWSFCDVTDDERRHQMWSRVDLDERKKSFGSFLFILRLLVRSFPVSIQSISGFLGPGCLTLDFLVEDGESHGKCWFIGVHVTDKVELEWCLHGCKNIIRKRKPFYQSEIPSFPNIWKC